LEANFVETIDWNWKSTDGLDIYSCGWIPKGKSKAVICLLHGHGEHIHRYDHVGSALAEKGYILLGFDLRGHGKSAGARGRTPSYDVLLDDIADFLTQAKERYPGLPLFLYGHSLGGNLGLNYVMRRKPDLRGVIATGTWLKLAYEPPAVKLILGRIMNGIAPDFTQHTKLDANGLSHDPSVVSAYRNDPLVHDLLSAGLFISIQDSGLWALEHAAEFPLPLLMMQGSADPISSARANQEFVEKVGDKATFKMWNGLFHEIHNEPEQDKVIKMMIDWLDKQLRK
jgi:alpha-beta hydrolase superfamily lysophospholipase